MNWTDEQISALSPDDSTERRGRMLANSSKWDNIATNEQAIWGECKGSGAQPYVTQINLSGPKFKCSCPVRRPPCKHVLGLFFLYAKNSSIFKKNSPPDAIQDWLAKHLNTAKETSIETPIKTDAEVEKSASDKEKRWQQRLDLMASGMEELELWLTDLVRQGIVNTEAPKASFWNQPAAKMVDAKIPRISNFLKETHQLIVREQDWTELVVARLGELYFWVEAFKKRDLLAPEMQEELYVALGKTVQKAEVLANDISTTDNWLVIGKKEGVDIEGRNFRRVWVQGQKSKETALILDFSFGHIGYDVQYLVGHLLEGKLIYYSANYKQRAIFENFESAKSYIAPAVSSYASMNDFLGAYSQAISKNPWLSQFPVAIEKVVAQLNEQGVLELIDQNKAIIPLGNLEEESVWKILAISGGHSLHLFGEWNGLRLEPLSLFTESSVVNLF